MRLDKDLFSRCENQFRKKLKEALQNQEQPELLSTSAKSTPIGKSEQSTNFNTPNHPASILSKRNQAESDNDMDLEMLLGETNKKRAKVEDKKPEEPVVVLYDNMV